MPVHIWNHKNSSGYAAMSKTDMYDMLEETFTLFRKEVGVIEFYIKEVTYPNNSPHYNLANNGSALDAMFNNYYDANAMNVHLVNNAPSAGYAALPGNCLYVSNKRNFATLAHEFGHNFGLEHTHHGRWPCSGDNETCADCWQEPVSRSMGQPAWCGNFNNKKKCEVNGDKLCDTAGEPNLFGHVTSDCAWNPIPTNGDVADNWGATRQPNTRNIMSYSKDSCRAQFTWGQVGVMLDELSKNRFDFKSTTPQYTISGPTDLCPNETYTYSIPQQGTGLVHYLWSIPQVWSISGQGNSTVSITTSPSYQVEDMVYVNPIEGGSVAPKIVEVDDLTVTISGPGSVPPDGTCKQFTTEYHSGISYTWNAAVPSQFPTVQPTLCGGQGTNTVQIRTPSNMTAAGYYVSVQLSNVCGYSIGGNKYVAVDGNSGPAAIALDEDVDIYPNPTSNELILESDEIIKDITIINVSTGKQIIYQEEHNANKSFDLSSCPNGIYMIQYEVNGEIRTHKIIKQ